MNGLVSISTSLLAMLLSSLIVVCLSPSGITTALGTAADNARERVNRTNVMKRATPHRARYTQKEKDVMLAKHNSLRATIKEANYMPSLKWDPALEKEAQRWADQCEYRHPKPDETEKRKGIGGYDNLGQNLNVGNHYFAKDVSVPAQQWWRELKDYTYGLTTWDKIKKCGHFIQMAWSKTTALGCAVAYCDALKYSRFKKGYLVVCEYGPGGNRQFQTPYSCNGQCPAKPGGKFTPNAARSLHRQTSLGLTANVLVGLVVFVSTCLTV